MPRFSTKRHEQILTEMIAKVVARSDLSDLSDASPFKHVLSASAMSDDEQYYNMYLLLKLFDIDKASGEDLDARAAEIQPGELTRYDESKGVGTVVFSRDTVSGVVTKSAGIVSKTTSGLEYITTTGFTINPSDPPVLPGHTTGQDSVPVAMQAVKAGADTNVSANTIIKFASKPTGIDSVTNPSAVLQGADEESDDAFRKRIKIYVRSLARATVYGVEGSVIGATDPDTGAVILYAKTVENLINLGYVTLYIDDGTGYAQSTEVVTGENVTHGLAGPPPDSAVGGETYLFLDHIAINNDAAFTLTSSVNGVLTETTDYYLDPTTGQINFLTALVAAETITANYTRYTGLIELAQKIINGDPNDRLNYPGSRGAGVQIQVKTPQVLIQNVEASIVISEGYDNATVLQAVETAILKSINTLDISGDVIVKELTKVIKSVEGVYDLTYTTPTNNVLILDDQLARTTANNLDIN